MSTIVVSGLGVFGGWVVEFLARTPGVDRIVAIDRVPRTAPSRLTMAMIGSVFQGHTKAFDYHQVDLSDADRLARLLAEIRPDAIVHTATMQSPRRFMNASIDEGLRAAVRRATFGMWLPWHLLPATLLTEAVGRSGIETHTINVAFPDVVNVALWKHFGFGPRAGAGNVEVCAAWVLRYAMEATGADPADIEVSLVGSHALLAKGTEVPHHFRLSIAGRDVTDEFDLDRILKTWPEPTDWGRADVFSLFAASAVKNAVALVEEAAIDSHVTAPDGLPGGYPARIGNGEIRLDLPEGIDRDRAVAINDDAARWDGIDRIEADGTIVYTEAARAAMTEIGYECEAVAFDGLAGQAERLLQFYDRLTA